MQFDINVTGLDTLAASISDLAEALKTVFTANEVIAKASTRKPRTPAPAAAVFEEVATSDLGKPNSSDSPTAPVTAPDAGCTSSSSYSAETAVGNAESNTPSEPIPAHQAEAATFGTAAKGEKPTVAEVRAAIAALAKTDKAKALGILAKFGAPSVSALKEENYSQVLSEANAS